jgi:hypothetical protein
MNQDQLRLQLVDDLRRQYPDGQWWKMGGVEVCCKNWTITLDQYNVPVGKTVAPHTRFRAPYVNTDGFRFCVYNKSVFTELGQVLGLVQDIEIGDEFFDREFVIQGNSADKVREMLRNRELRAILEAQPYVCFEVKDDEGWFGSKFPDGVDEVYLLLPGHVQDFERLGRLFQLFATVLHHLNSTGSASAQDPGLSLK